ncbi:MAG TPA: hypothetical protein VFA60_00630 [Terriglobales bacterium]|nr:hypothetical protein [Terriglobales bacterium]
MTEFEKIVLSDLATLKAQVLSIVGNGQPGRLQRLELQVEEHETAIQRATGIALILAPLVAAAHLVFDYLRARVHQP